MMSGKERIIARVDQERRYGDALQIFAAACTRPIVVGALESVQRRSYELIEFVQIAGAQHTLDIIDSRKCTRLVRAFRLEGAQEVPGVEPVEAASQPVPGDGEVDRCGHRGRRA